MSLISDALKKADTQTGTLQGNTAAHSHSSKALWVYRAALVGAIALVLAGLAVVTRKPYSSPHLVIRDAEQTQVAAVPMPEPQLAKADGFQLLRKAQGLSGIISTSNGESMALVDNQIVQKGDQVRGMTVVSINPGSVELQDANGKAKTLKLED